MPTLRWNPAHLASPTGDRILDGGKTLEARSCREWLGAIPDDAQRLVLKNCPEIRPFATPTEFPSVRPSTAPPDSPHLADIVRCQGQLSKPDAARPDEPTHLPVPIADTGTSIINGADCPPPAALARSDWSRRVQQGICGQATRGTISRGYTNGDTSRAAVGGLVVAIAHNGNGRYTVSVYVWSVSRAGAPNISGCFAARCSVSWSIRSRIGAPSAGSQHAVPGRGSQGPLSLRSSGGGTVGKWASA